MSDVIDICLDDVPAISILLHFGWQTPAILFSRVGSIALFLPQMSVFMICEQVWLPSVFSATEG